MRNPRTTILLLAMMVTAFGLSSRLRQDKGRIEALDFSANSRGTVGQKVSSEEAQNSVESVRVPTAAPYQSIALAKVTRSVSLSADENTLVSEMCSLHLLAEKADLSLNSREWSAFATVVLQIQTIRQEYEAQIATSQKIAPGKYRLEIPSYAGVGDVLRAKFSDELRTELGDAKARDVLTKMGTQLEGHFAGFGVSTQILDITTGPTGSFNDVEVKRTVTYWNSTEGSDRLTTRREVHYPAYEDPTGEGLSALLAMVKA